ncbi:PTS transporter subunit IIC [Endozoicomonadaceae bacterium StTr2]
MAAAFPAISAYLTRKSITPSLKVYFIDAMGYMALGLFASLLTGSILATLGRQFEIAFLSETLWPIARSMTGPAIAVAVASALKAPPLVLFASTVCGAAGAAAGGPVGAFVAAVIGTEFGKLIAGETPVDILVTPATTLLTGVLTAQLVGPWIGGLMDSLGEFISYSTHLQPLLMGSLLAVIMGVCLTLPISSAAIAIMLSLDGLAAGAATVGCATQMVGFAVMSFRENGWGGVVAQGIGTSMIQMPNIIRNPLIWIPPVLTSAILGPFATVVFKLENTPLGAGMGTSGLVGQLETFAAMLPSTENTLWLTGIIILMHIVLPALLCLGIAGLMRRMGLIHTGDMKLKLS